MNAHETRIWSELMKLPTGILQSIVETIPGGALLPRRLTVKSASRDDLAKALAPWLARRDFMREPTREPTSSETDG